MTSVKLSIFIILAVCLSVFASAQDGSIPTTTPPVETPPAETPVPTPDTGSAVPATPRPVEPSPETSTAAVSSAPLPSLNLTTLPSATPLVSPAPFETNPPIEAFASDSRFVPILFGVAAAFGLSGIIYAFTRQKKHKKDEGKCDNIRSLLEQKKKEYEEMIRGWPEEKLKSLAENRVRGLIKKNKDAKEVLEAVDEIQAKYNKVKETIELLQKKYDLCMLDFNGLAKKRVFIIHGWGGHPDEAWLPWLKKELTAKGYDVTVPTMPDTNHPKLETWVSHLSKLVGKPDENTYFVGHSIGCQTILRYLGALLPGTKVGGAVFVAGWLMLDFTREEDAHIPIGKPWVETPVDFEKIRHTSKNFTAIFSDNDDVIPLAENEKILRENLGAKIIIEKGMGHFTDEDGVKELPSALEPFK